MTRATLTDVLGPALARGQAVAGLVVLGWEDARAYVRAAEAESAPVILQAGPGCRAHTPLPVLGTMFRVLAEGAAVPVVAHLDHGDSLELCRQAIDCGFTSVMYDGSALDLAHNIERTADIVAMAHAAGVSVEGELGHVGYHGTSASTRTDPDEARIFAAATGVDALAVSVGTSHLMTEPAAAPDFELLTAIAAATPGLPLVLHGGSGIPIAQRARLARETAVCKINLGTELRQAFGAALRKTLAADPAVFDRIRILTPVENAVMQAARQAIRSLGRH
jgi:fructose-bisphosphate aldolase class II